MLRSSFTASVCVGTVLALSVRADACAPTGSAGPERTVALSVRGAAQERPALRVQLLPPVREMRGGNAAMDWVQALLAVPVGEDRDRCVAWLELDRTELAREEVRTHLGIRLDDAAAGADCYDRLRAAARRWSCHWQIDLGDDAFMLELGRFRSAARTLALRARIQIAIGDLDDAIETLQVGIALARDVGNGPTIVHGLVGVACMNLILDEIEALVAAPGSPNLYWALADLPDPLIDLRPALRRERHLLEVMAPELEGLRRIPPAAAGTIDTASSALIDRILAVTGDVDPGDPPAAAGARLALAGAAARAYPDAVEHLVAQGHARSAVEAAPVIWTVLRYALDRFEAHRDDVHKWLALPYREGVAGLAAIDARMQETNFDPMQIENLFIGLMPQLTSMRTTQAVLERRLAALRCVEAVRDHVARAGGVPGSRTDVALPFPEDPMRGEPFELRRDGDVVVIEATAVPGALRPDREGEGTLTYRLHFRD